MIALIIGVAGAGMQQQQAPIEVRPLTGLPVVAYRYDRTVSPKIDPGRCSERVRTADGTLPLSPGAMLMLPDTDVSLLVDPTVPGCLFRRVGAADRVDAIPLPVGPVLVDDMPYRSDDLLDAEGRFTAVADWQTLIATPSPAGFRLTVIGSGAVRDPGATETDLVHRPGTLFALTIEVDPSGTPTGLATVWPFWHRVYGGGASGVALPGEWFGTEGRPAWLVRQLGPDPARPSLPLGIVDLASVRVDETGFGDRGTEVLLVAQGRVDRLHWVLGDLRGFPLVSGVVGLDCADTVLPVVPVLARTDTPTDQLRRVSQVDAMAVDTRARSLSLVVATRGAVDHDALVETWEEGVEHWHHRSLRPAHDPSRVPVSPLPQEVREGPPGWQLEATGATLIGSHLVVGLGQPVPFEQTWVAGLLQLPATVLDPGSASFGAPSTCGLELAHALYDEPGVAELALPTDDAYRLRAVLGEGPVEVAGPVGPGQHVLGQLLRDRSTWGDALRARYERLALEVRAGTAAYLQEAPFVRIQPQIGGLVAAVEGGPRDWEGGLPLVDRCAEACGPCAGSDGMAAAHRPAVRLEDGGRIWTLPGAPPTVAVDHQIHAAGPQGQPWFNSWALTPSGRLVQQAWVREGEEMLRCGSALIHDLRPSYGRYRRYDAERFRRSTGLLTASLWESRWLYRYTDLLAPSDEAELVTRVQHALQEQSRWPLSVPAIGEAAAIEILDQDRVILIAMQGRAAEIREIGMPVPVHFVEVAIVPDATVAQRQIPPPLVVASRIPWLQTVSMREDLSNWLAARFGEDGERAFVLADLHYDPDTNAVFAALEEPAPPGEPRRASYHRLTLDQPFFSPILTPSSLTPSAEVLDPSTGAPAIVGVPTGTALRVPVGDGYGWVVVPRAGFAKHVQRQREQPCLDPSDPSCEVF